MDRNVNITDEEKRRRLKAFWVEWRRVETLSRRMLADEKKAMLRAEFYVNHGFYPPREKLPSFPKFPSECVNLTCGGKGRRSGLPCQSKAIYPNGRCKWHGGASTGPKTEKGKAKTACNLLLPKVIGT